MHSRISLTTFLIATCAVFAGAGDAFAHDGHGLTGTHWHATDGWGFVVVGCLSAAAIWFARKGK